MQQEKPLRKSQLHSAGYTFSSTPAISATITSFNSILFEIWICSFSYRRAVRICHFDDYSCRTMWYGLILCYLRVLWYRKDSVCHACLWFCLIFCVVHMGRREIGRGYNDLQRWWYTNYYSLIIMIKNVMLLIFNNIKKWFCCIVYSVLLLCCVPFDFVFVRRLLFLQFRSVFLSHLQKNHTKMLILLYHSITLLMKYVRWFLRVVIS